MWTWIMWIPIFTCGTQVLKQGFQNQLWNFDLWKESKQHRNWAKFDLSCYQRFGDIFGRAKGAVSFLIFWKYLFRLSLCTHLQLFFGNFLKLLDKNKIKTRICSTGLETGCKPVLFEFAFPIWMQTWKVKKTESICKFKLF